MATVVIQPDRTTPQDGTGLVQQSDKTGRLHASDTGKTSFATSSHYDSSYCIGFQPPRGHLSSLGTYYNCPTLSYKRLRQAPLLRDGQTGGKGKAQAHTGLSNTTQFSRGCRILRSGDPNHINLHVHHVHPRLVTKRPKPPIIKEPQRAAPVAALVEVSQNHFDIWRAR
jgi:hypothetical protein